MAKKESKFDRVLTGKEASKRVMKELDDPKSPWGKERAMDMAIGSATGSGVTAKLGGTQPVTKAIEMSKKVTSGMGRMKDFVKESNAIDDIARSKGVHKIKTTAGPGKGKVKYISSKKENVEAFRDKDFSRKMLQNNLKEGKRQAIKYPNKESASDLKEIEMNWHNAQTSEKGFTKRGKPIGKPIGDQGFQGSNSSAKRAKYTKEASTNKERLKVQKHNRYAEGQKGVKDVVKKNYKPVDSSYRDGKRDTGRSEFQDRVSSTRYSDRLTRWDMDDEAMRKKYKMELWRSREDTASRPKDAEKYLKLRERMMRKRAYRDRTKE